jgi:serine/threonine-protein kinase
MALKLQRSECTEVPCLLEHEARVLRQLDGDPGPRLLRTGEHEGRRYLLLEWCPGSDVDTAAQEWRRRQRAAGPRRLLRICHRVAAAYGRLHQRGIVHGDVHALNVLIDSEDRVRLIDFGLARFSAEHDEPGAPIERGGVPLFLEPEFARPVLAAEPPPPPTAEGEQYAVAALLYQLMTGFPYLDFNLEHRAMLRQIVSVPPVPFDQRGLAPWPEIEAVLARALDKEPGRRFPSLAALAERLAAVVVPQPAATTRSAADDPLTPLPARLLSRVPPENPLHASLFLGSAGVAYALYRGARLREEPSLLSLAETWLDRTGGVDSPNDGLLDPDPSGETDRIAESSPFHTASGIHAVRAMIASAGARPRRHASAVEAWLDATRRPSGNPDLITGRSGSLLAAALLAETWLKSSPADLARVTELGNQIRDDLWDSLAREPGVSETLGQVGIAHGWGGFLFATLRWCAVTSTDLHAEAERRLLDLAKLAQPAGRGLIWPWELPWSDRDQPGFMSGWCSGSAGYVLLFALAADFLPQAGFGDLALGAGWNAWESSQREGSLCCGLAGRAYAMLRLHRMTGDAVWLDRARDLTRIATREGRFDQTYPCSLYKGPLGMELLAVELEQPELARFPFF